MRRVGTIVQVLLASILLLDAIDWAVLHIRMARGTAFQTVQINQYLATPLKGNKAEYDYMGTQQETCSRSLFPQADNSPCWWLSRHTTRWQQ
jgi:hypothetical protein